MDHTHYAVLDKIVGVFGSWIPIVDKTVLLKASSGRRHACQGQSQSQTARFFCLIRKRSGGPGRRVP